MAPNIPVSEALAEINHQDEADAREGIEDAGEFGADTGDTGDGDGGGEGGDQRRARAEPSLPPGVLKRQSIVDNYRRPDMRPFDGDMTRAENLYGEVADEHLDPDPGADEPGVQQADQPVTPKPEPTAQPKRKLLVRGNVVEMSDDEVLAAAQKTLAGDSYLEDARRILEEAKTIKAERAGRASQHPENDERTQDDEQDRTPSDRDARHPGHDLKSVVEKIQFGDPDEAAALLAETIQRTSTEAATKAANEGHVNRLIANDLKRSQDELKAFREANQALNGDEIAEQVISNEVLKIYREELTGLGVDASQIPSDPKTLSDWHRFYRVNGHNVSKTSDILNKAKERFDGWRGSGNPTNKQVAPRKEAPRVAVNVDRTVRRQTIPQQPTRAVVPPRSEAPPQTVEQSRKGAVAEMRKARGQTTG